MSYKYLRGYSSLGEYSELNLSHAAGRYYLTWQRRHTDAADHQATILKAEAEHLLTLDDEAYLEAAAEHLGVKVLRSTGITELVPA